VARKGSEIERRRGKERRAVERLSERRERNIGRCMIR